MKSLVGVLSLTLVVSVATVNLEATPDSVLVKSVVQASIVGKWKTIDDDSGDAKSVVEITERNGKFFGRILKLFRKPGEDPDPVCDQCADDDPRFNKKVIGMEIIQDMVKDGDEYNGGRILDPKVGKVYRCRLWLEGKDLKVRGYVGPFYRTQSWVKFE